MSTTVRGYRRVLVAAVALVLSLSSGAGVLSAQNVFPPTTPRFQDVLRLAQEGHPDSARRVIQRTIAAMTLTDPAYAEALYTSAAIPETVDDARLLYLRITREYPNSGWADKALYRLALLDYINQVDASLTTFQRIFTDYPLSPVIPQAALWGSRAAFETNRLQEGCDWLRRGIARAGEDVELRNKLEAGRSRCSVGVGVDLAPPPLTESLPTRPVTPPPPPPARADTAKATPPATAPAVADKYRVQVAAISSQAAITRTVRSLEQAGFKVWQVKSGGLVKLQAGPFATRQAAQDKLPQLTKLVGGKPFIVATP